MYVPDRFIEDMQLDGGFVTLLISRRLKLPQELRTIETDRLGRWSIRDILHDRSTSSGVLVKAVYQEQSAAEDAHK